MAEAYMVDFCDYLSTNNLHPKWAKDLTRFLALPRVLDIATPDTFNHIIKVRNVNRIDDYNATIWIIDNLRGTWGSRTYGAFYFRDSDDAMHFRLVWG